MYERRTIGKHAVVYAEPCLKYNIKIIVLVPYFMHLLGVFRINNIK